MRHAPPGRTSSSHTGLVKRCGPHHCSICFGSVHALNTISGGASKTRVMTSSPCSLLAALLFMDSYSFIQFGKRAHIERKRSLSELAHLNAKWPCLVCTVH